MAGSSGSSATPPTTAAPPTPIPVVRAAQGPPDQATPQPQAATAAVGQAPNQAATSTAGQTVTRTASGQTRVPPDVEVVLPVGPAAGSLVLGSAAKLMVRHGTACSVCVFCGDW